MRSGANRRQRAPRAPPSRLGKVATLNERSRTPAPIADRDLRPNTRAVDRAAGRDRAGGAQAQKDDGHHRPEQPNPVRGPLTPRGGPNSSSARRNLPNEHPSPTSAPPHSQLSKGAAGVVGPGGPAIPIAGLRLGRRAATSPSTPLRAGSNRTPSPSLELTGTGRRSVAVSRKRGAHRYPIGTSPLVPQRILLTPLTYQVPVDGRHTAMSARWSPL